MPNRRDALFTLSLVAIGLARPAAAQPTAYPNRTITLVVPFPPGAATDASARILAPLLARELGQQVIVENVSGASGSIAVRRSLAARPDGHSLHFGTVNDVVIVPATTVPPPYGAKDLAPVGKTFVTDLAFVASNAVAESSIDELVQSLKKRPKAYSMAHPGAGTVQHLAGTAIAAEAGVEWVPVAYKGSAPITQDILGGHVQLAIMTLPSALPLINAGKVKPLGLLRKTRDPEHPSLPTVNEGRVLKDVQFEQWNGLFAPPKTPATVIQRLEEALQNILRDPEFRAAQAKLGANTPASTSPFAFEREIASDAAMYSAIAAKLPKE